MSHVFGMRMSSLTTFGKAIMSPDKRLLFKSDLSETEIPWMGVLPHLYFLGSEWSTFFYWSYRAGRWL
jgi:hypothetical protein